MPRTRSSSRWLPAVVSAAALVAAIAGTLAIPSLRRSILGRDAVDQSAGMLSEEPVRASVDDAMPAGRLAGQAPRVEIEGGTPLSGVGREFGAEQSAEQNVLRVSGRCSTFLLWPSRPTPTVDSESKACPTATSS